MIKILIRNLIYTLVGHMLRFFINYEKFKKNNIQDIIILGRGDSLNLFPKNKITKLKKIKNIICVNFEPKDFRVIKNCFKHNIIHLFLNISEPVPNFNQIMKIKFGKIVFSKPKNKRINYKSNILGNKTEYPPEEHKEGIIKLKNTGLGAIKFFIFHTEPKNIYLFGFNFYSASYHDKTLEEFFENKSQLKNHQIARERLEKGFISIIMDYPKINFYFFGDYKFKICPHNLKIMN